MLFGKTLNEKYHKDWRTYDVRWWHFPVQLTDGRWVWRQKIERRWIRHSGSCSDWWIMSVGDGEC